MPEFYQPRVFRKTRRICFGIELVEDTLGALVMVEEDGDASMGLDGRHVRSARAALNWTVIDLANASGLEPAEIRAVEDGGKLYADHDHILIIVRALERAGIIFSAMPNKGIRVIFPL